MTSWTMRIFLPPKEAQPKVRQSHGNAVENNFAFLTDFSVPRDPLDHLIVKEGKVINENISILNSKIGFTRNFF